MHADLQVYVKSAARRAKTGDLNRNTSCGEGAARCGEYNIDRFYTASRDHVEVNLKNRTQSFISISVLTLVHVTSHMRYRRFLLRKEIC